MGTPVSSFLRIKNRKGDADGAVSDGCQIRSLAVHPFARAGIIDLGNVGYGGSRGPWRTIGEVILQSNT